MNYLESSVGVDRSALRRPLRAQHAGGPSIITHKGTDARSHVRVWEGRRPGGWRERVGAVLKSRREDWSGHEGASWVREGGRVASERLYRCTPRAAIRVSVLL